MERMYLNMTEATCDTPSVTVTLTSEKPNEGFFSEIRNETRMPTLAAFI